jgi:RimJ/RimL family protein N-acetyltransferase
LVREGQLVRLRQHVPANKSAFQRWYADPEIAYLLRHDLEPLSAGQAAGYFDSLILPLSQRGLCFAIHEADTDRLIGTTALTDLTRRTSGRRSALFRIVIGEKDVWDRGYGTEATRLVVAEAFATHDLNEVRLEVFRHNPRAIKAYERVGFAIAGEHVEWVGRSRRELNVIEMRLRRPNQEEPAADEAGEITPAPVEDEPAAPGESAAEQAARIARRRELRQHRRSQRETRDVTEGDASGSTAMVEEPRLEP